MPAPDAAERIELAASKGATMTGIAHHVGVNAQTMRRWFDEHAELKEAFDRGREKERMVLHNTLYVAAEGGNIVAAMFLLKSRHGYREGDQGDLGNRLNITFNIPGAVKASEYINGEPRTIELPAASVDRS